MAYIVHQFDGIALPIELRSGDQQDIGTGDALTAFLPLAGGGFFDNYGSAQSPQNIRPVTKRGLLIADSVAELITKFDALRAKIGVRGRLAVLLDDNTVRWQWARLQSVSTPRPSEAKALWLPLELTFVSADQSWRGAIHSGTAWTWGDGSWVFGDGSAEFGEAGNTYTLTNPLALSLTNGGNKTSTDLRISITPTFTLDSITITNSTVSPNLSMVYAGTITSGEELIIDCGARSVTLDGADAYANISVLTDKTQWIPMYVGANDIDITLNLVSGTVGGDVVCDWTDYWA